MLLSRPTGGWLTAASDGQRSTRKEKNQNAKNGRFAAIFDIWIFCKCSQRSQRSHEVYGVPWGRFAPS